MKVFSFSGVLVLFRHYCKYHQSFAGLKSFEATGFWRCEICLYHRQLVLISLWWGWQLIKSHFCTTTHTHTCRSHFNLNVHLLCHLPKPRRGRGRQKRLCLTTSEDTCICAIKATCWCAALQILFWHPSPRNIVFLSHCGKILPMFDSFVKPTQTGFINKEVILFDIKSCVRMVQFSAHYWDLNALWVFLLHGWVLNRHQPLKNITCLRAKLLNWPPLNYCKCQKIAFQRKHGGCVPINTFKMSASLFWKWLYTILYACFDISFEASFKRLERPSGAQHSPTMKSNKSNNLSLQY